MAGERLSLADLMVAPLLGYLNRLPERTLLAEHPNLAAWLARIEERQSFQVTKPERL
jgi:glutathione S-transferase